MARTQDRSTWPGILDGRPQPVFAYPVTASEYLEFDEASDTKHELVDGFIYAMAGASAAHITIVANLVAAIHPMLRGKGCRDLFNDMKLAIPSATDTNEDQRSSYYYPDFLITCSKTEMDPSLKIVEQPCLVVEVMSPSTSRRDRTEKLDNYKRIPSLEQYWLIEQDRHRVIVYTRDGSGWRETVHTSPQDVLTLPVELLEIRLADIYLDVFEPSSG